MKRCTKPLLPFLWLLLTTDWTSNSSHLVVAFQSVVNRLDHVSLVTCQQSSGDHNGFNDVPAAVTLTRRSIVSKLAVYGVTSGFLLTRPIVPVAVADTGAEVRGTPVNAFNGLAFQYRGSDFNGLTATNINEPSISYQEFVSKLKSGDVLFVEFYAPDGDVAYATLKSTSNNQNNKIRIGEGYPIEQHDGYSSPAFAIRTVKNAKVPYKFVVPALAKSKE
jgi:hypothetical protein